MSKQHAAPTRTASLCRTRLGWVYLERTTRGLSRVDLPAKVKPRSPAGPGARFVEDSLLAKASELIRRYCEGEVVSFDLPLDLEAVPLGMRALLTAARRIPYGRTRSYGWVAARAGRPRAARAAGQAMARNPLPLIIPCHRVIGADGSLVGYGGGLALKRRLLELERAALKGR